MKTGRNELCPCGSGKKYKKCCGMQEELPDFSLPEELMTGTRLDEYMQLMQMVAIYHQGLTEFDDDRKELKKAVKDFEKRFRPGTDQGISDGLYVPWYLFDLRFGKSGKTVCERFLDLDEMKSLDDNGRTLIRHMSDSYAAFYEVAEITQEWIRFIELGTDVPWSVNRIQDPYDEEINIGDIWYTRFIGPSDDAFEFSSPYMFSPDAKDDFLMALTVQVVKARKTLGDLIGPEALFRESCKVALTSWAEYMFHADDGFDDEMSDDEYLEPPMPSLCNADGDELRICKIVFKINDDKGLKEKLSSMRDIDYDERNKTWVWFRKGDGKLPISPRSVLATIMIKRGRLVCETNSEERAEKLIGKLKRALKGIITFEKVDVSEIG